MKYYNIILASASPRRKELLKNFLGIDAEVFPSSVDETKRVGLSPQEVVLELSQNKATDVFKKISAMQKYALGSYIVLGADTIVVANNGKILEKPADKMEAESFFRLLCGNTHAVYSGVCLLGKEKIIKNYEKTYVTFGAFSDKIVYNYIESGKPLDKAGGYGIQDSEIAPLIKKVDGSITNVVGLPIELVNKMLLEF